MLWGIEQFNLQQQIARHPWLLAVVFGPSFVHFASPAMAQATGSGDGACAGAGLFSPLANFAFTTFSAFNIGSGSSTISQAAQYVCAIIAVLFVVLVIAMLAGAGYTAVQLSTGTPLTVLVQPLSGLMLFIVMAIAILTLLIGSA
jgi:hypothetical protein